ncbi:hypothetical protein [Polaribacter sp.]|uniref:hypothetical protein n=1 Tax=Polaribacter sp. TaxID=1920175 RepID=UPI003EF84164
MKKSVLLFVLGLTSITVLGQDIAVKKKFFTTENFRLGAVLGADLSWAGDNGKTALISQKGTIEEENILYSKTPNTSYFLGFDAYSPTSTLGFMAGVSINLQEYSIKNKNLQVTDSIKTTNIEIPVYAKLRMGNVIKGGQFWLALGGGYSLTTQATATRVTNSNSITKYDVKNSFQSNLFISSIVGYEFSLDSKSKDFLNRDSFRILLYAKGNYDLGNRLDETTLNNNATLNSYTDPSLKFLRVSLGLKILLRLSKAGEVLTNAAKLKYQ